MKRVFFLVIMLVVLASSFFAVYLWIIRPDPTVVSGEVEGLEAIRPRNMRIVETSSDYFVVEWEVDTSVSGYVKYGDTSNSLSLLAQDVEGAVPLKKHRVRVSNLTPGKKYYFWVMSDDVAFGRNGKALEVLTTVD